MARLEAALRDEPSLADVASEGALPRPEIQITPLREEAARLGITTADIAQVVRVATIGDIDAALAKVSIDDRLIPVRVQLDEASREDLSRIASLKITAANGVAVPLSSVADVRIAEGPSTVDRLNRERRATIGANLPWAWRWGRRARASTRSSTAWSCRRRCACRNRAMPRCSRN